MTTEWTYRGEPFTDPGAHWGFVYRITCLTNGKQYIGRKIFSTSKSRQVKKKRKKYRVESDWKTYWSSSQDVQDEVARLGEAQFTREILRLCDSKSSLAYWETYYIFHYHALIHPNWYNQWVSCRIRRSNLRATDIENT
jgi:hypothetical protein